MSYHVLSKARKEGFRGNKQDVSNGISARIVREIMRIVRNTYTPFDSFPLPSFITSSFFQCFSPILNFFLLSSLLLDLPS